MLVETFVYFFFCFQLCEKKKKFELKHDKLHIRSISRVNISFSLFLDING